MKAQESIAVWFEELARCGESVEIINGFRNIETGQLEEHRYHHGNHDGISSFHRLLADRGLGFNQSELKVRGRVAPPAIYQYWSFVRYLFTIPFRSANWLFPKTGWTPQNSRGFEPLQGVLLLSAAETKKVQERARALGVRTNALLLWALNEALEVFLASRGPRIWMIPASLRSNDFQNQIGNYTGFFDIQFLKGTSVQVLNQLLNEKVSNGSAYGGYIGVTLGRWLGRRLLSILVRANFRMQIRTGVFSNMGSYGKDEGAIEEHPYGYSPVIRSQPVGANTIVWRGHRVLCVQIHPILSTDSGIALRILEAWKAKLLS